MAELKLSRERVLELIHCYEQRECLWNFTNALYKRVDLKNKAWAELAAKFGTTVPEVKRKVKSLRSAYVSEKKKVDDSKTSGASGDVYEPSLYYFNEFRYLDGAIVLRKSSNNAEEVYISGEETKENENPVPETEEVVEESRTDNATVKRRKRRSWCTAEAISAQYDAAVQEIVNHVKQKPEEEDLYMTFAKSLAMQLKNLPEVNAQEAMLELQSVICRHTKEFLNQRQSASRNRVQILSQQVITPTSHSTSSSGKGILKSNQSGISIVRRATPLHSHSGNSSNILQTAMLDADLYNDAMLEYM